MGELGGAANEVVCADGLARKPVPEEDPDEEPEAGINLDRGPGKLLLSAPREKKERGGGGGFFRIDFFGVVGTMRRGLGTKYCAPPIDGPTGELVDEEATGEDEDNPGGDDEDEDDEASGWG